jgi:gluconate 2-dehydrogenase gamma chain
MCDQSENHSIRRKLQLRSVDDEYLAAACAGSPHSQRAQCGSEGLRVRKVTRREVLAAVGAAAAVPASVLFATSAAASPAPTPKWMFARHSAAPVYLFFNAAEARFIEAACERLIPADASGPGALAAGVPGYLDRHLAGAWGAGERLYRNGPWQPGTPAQGQPPPFTPATLFRTALCAILRSFEKGSAPYGAPYGASYGPLFSELPASAQDSYLRSLEAGRVDLDGAPSAVFFDMLLTMTVEGFFSDPLYGRFRDRIAWQMHGFPGAYAAASASASAAASATASNAAGQRLAAPGNRWRHPIATVESTEPPLP